VPLTLARLLRWWSAALCLAALAACHRAAPLPDAHDVYIWQRAWRPALGDAIAGAGDLVRQWRVLAAEVAPDGRLLAMAVDPAMLSRAPRPVVMVVRIDGQLAGLDEAALVRQIATLHARWRDNSLAPAGLEIDHDCGLARLPGYAVFLARLRAALPRGTPLSITALPAWLESPLGLEAVLTQADEAVLQVHAVKQPRLGLFDAEQARRWAAAFGERTTRPFRIALPTYSSRVSFDALGNLAAVESEAPALAQHDEQHELSVAPSAVAALLARLKKDPPPHLLGWVWFRLPTAEDRRAWHLQTWRAVVQARALAPAPALQWRASAEAGLYDVVLANTTALDAELPPAVYAPRQCALADARGGYQLHRQPARWQFLRPRAGLLPPRSELVIGWLRCDAPPPPPHAPA
jgi:hypothetical protein